MNTLYTHPPDWNAIGSFQCFRILSLHAYCILPLLLNTCLVVVFMYSTYKSASRKFREG